MLQVPVVSVIIIEYNSLPEVRVCIDSLRKTLDNNDHEIIVTSNSSYDESRQKEITEDFQNVIWQFNGKNLGFAAAMNKGLEIARGEYLAIVNSDVEIIDGFSSMIEFMGNNREVGAVGPKMINSEGRIQDSCRPYVSLHMFLLRQFNRIILKKVNPLEKGFEYNVTQTVDWLSGAFIMVRKELYTLTNGLNPAYFLYAEDMDWCTRIRMAGYEIVYFPEMMVRYSGTRSARKLNRFTLIFIRSHIRYWRQFGFFSGYPGRNEKNIKK